MNSISPHMLRLASGAVAFVDDPGGGGGRPSSLSRLLKAAARRRWILAGGVAAGLAAGLLLTLLATRQYTATERLEISRDTAQVVNLGATSRDVPVGDQEFYQTEYGLLRTQALAERVATDLGLVDDADFFRTFHKSAKFAENPGAAGRARRSQIAGQVLLAHVVVAPVHGSSLVDVAATTPSADLSVKIAQTWGRDFIASTLERRVEAAGYARRYLEARIDQLRDRLEASERRAADYATANGIINLPSPTGAPGVDGADAAQTRSLVTDDLIATNSAREGAAAERIQAGSRLAAAGAEPGGSADALAYRAMGKLREQRAAAAADRARIVAQAGPDDPAARAAQAQVDALDAAIRSEQDRVRTSLRQTLQAVTTREAALDRRVHDLKATLAEQRQRAIQYNIYRRDADTNRQLYESLLQRYKEIGVAGEAESSNVAVVDAAKPPNRPSSPRLVLNLLLFTLAGAVVAAAAVAILEQGDDGVGEPGLFAERLGLPLLGTTPRLKAGAPLEALKDPRSPLSEAYLAVEANLKLAGRPGVPAAFAVTSTRPGEGVSTTALALARGLARARRRVVLVDANLRAPSLHHAFRLPNGEGLSELLAGADAGIETVVRATGVKDLSLVTAGGGVANPADLLIGDGQARVVKALLGRFDHVVLDCPAVADLADAPLLASAVESVVFVVAARVTPAARVRAALARLGEAQTAGGVLTLA